jgi:thymidylate synthase ThyX
MTMGYAAKILADSISPAGHRLTTFEVTFPRIVLAEFNTHRMISRNSASSRAIPVDKRIVAIAEDPFAPAVFGKNRRGMQATEELGEKETRIASDWWTSARASMVRCAIELSTLGVHKQLANRLLEPFSWHTVICTATDWENFFNLRCHPNAQPEIRTVAEMMREVYGVEKPSPTAYGEWHLPLVNTGEKTVTAHGDGWAIEAAKLSAARCARVSYLTHDGRCDPAADLDLYEKLASNGHMSPLEHPARPMTKRELGFFEQHVLEMGRREWLSAGRVTHYLGNFNGWVQLRKLVPGEAVFSETPK